MEITYSGSEGKTSKAKDVEEKYSKYPKLESVEAQTPLRKHKQRSSHSEELILGDKSEPVRTRSSFKSYEETLLGLVFLTKPT